MHFNFDPTINLGTILALFVFVGGMLRLIGKLSKIELQVQLMWQSWLATHNSTKVEVNRGN